jgi:hypothetical protein
MYILHKVIDIFGILSLSVALGILLLIGLSCLSLMIKEIQRKYNEYTNRN